MSGKLSEYQFPFFECAEIHTSSDTCFYSAGDHASVEALDSLTFVDHPRGQSECEGTILELLWVALLLFKYPALRFSKFFSFHRLYLHGCFDDLERLQKDSIMAALG